MDEQKQVKNLFKKLINDQNSVFYSSDKITRTLLNKGRKSSYEKDKVFYKIFNSIEGKDVIYDFDDGKKPKLPIYTPFVEQKKDIDRSSSLYSIDGPLQFFHADVAYLSFTSKSAVDPKYALICVNLFSSKIYVYPMRKKSNLAQKMELFYKEIAQKCNQKEKMRLQTDLEFQQNEIKKLNEKYNIEMFSTKTRGRKAFAAEQKIREFKKILFRSKRLHKSTKTTRLDSKKLIKNTVQNMNKTNSQKYDLPETIEKKSLENKNVREIYDFHRLVKVSKNAERYKGNDIKFDKKSHKKLRCPLLVGEKVLAEKLKKKDAQGNLYKNTTENIPFFNRDEIFIVRKILSTENSYHYWISKTIDGKITNNKFLRQELFALKNQFDWNGSGFYITAWNFKIKFLVSILAMVIDYKEFYLKKIEIII